MTTASTTSSARPQLRLLDLEVDPTEGHYRFCTPDAHFKYVTINTDVFPLLTMCAEAYLLPLLPPFPSGDWNTGRIAKDITSGQPCFTSVKKEDLPTIATWHPRLVNYLDLRIDEELRIKVYEATDTLTDAPVIAKYARFPSEIAFLAAETRAYAWIEGTGIGPKFLGHITEEDRAIGILLERVVGARHARPEDLALCRRSLARLHALGVKHGDVNRHNFLVLGRRAVLIDFEAAERCEDALVLGLEMEGLEAALRDTTHAGGMLIS